MKLERLKISRKIVHDKLCIRTCIICLLLWLDINSIQSNDFVNLLILFSIKKILIYLGDSFYDYHHLTIVSI
ncbi:hypothetical protein DERP_004097 [Dermatophagoides pteronyssinus]|uniref:Uncharacterized protein n=1 Tax=Dermatophagoides pteronyssinus TaxID=6956 RepID=A0ABQ8J866_DERPT|nr:hypothetical protein DERP_004097 [Dermatophagoides pteronyssinus]